MPINSAFSTDQSTISNNLVDPATTEGAFRTGVSSVLSAVTQINDEAVNAATHATVNDVTPVVVSKVGNNITVTSNIVVGTADPPTAGTHFQSGQIYFRVE